MFDFEPVISTENNFSEFLMSMRRREWDSYEAFQLNLRGTELTLQQPGDELTVLTHLQDYWRKIGFIHYPHQTETVNKVINQMWGRALLADEVGLGKTIEAGLILKEYLLRGQVKRFLILTPSSLCRQWESELREKFQIDTLIVRNSWEWGNYEHLIASLDTAKKEPHCQELLQNYYDLVIVDEAHKLKNSLTQNFKLVKSIPKKYFLLLSATPLQNDLKELFNLISLLRPGQLGSYSQFKKRFFAAPHEARDVGNLQNLLGEVMIRNKHAAELGFTERKIQNVPVTLSPVEKTLYQRTTSFISRILKKSSGNKASLALLTLQREICSSTFAALLTFYKLAQKVQLDDNEQAEALELLHLAQEIKDNAKMKIVREILQKSEEKVIIFTEFLPTQSYIRTRLEQAGILTLAFDGSLSATKKEFTKYQFKESPQYRVLVCTGAAGEGINLQFCNTMINYDLPWNPMRLEQRIGRIHRLGQTRDVYIYNLSVSETIEEYLLQLLYEKVRLFDNVIGESEQILSRLNQRKSWETRIVDLLRNSNNQTELGQNFEQLGIELETELLNESEKWKGIL